MYDDLAQLEVRLKQLIDREQQEKAVAETAKAVAASQTDLKSSGRPLVVVEAGSLEAAEAS